MSVAIEVDYPAEAGVLAGIRGRLDDLAGLHHVLVEQFKDYERQVFATSGFGRWDALDPDTIAAKGNPRPLVDTGGLLAELTTHPDVDRQGESVVVGTRRVGAIMAAAGRGGPQRNPIPTPEHRHVADWADALLGHLVDGAR